MYLAREVRLDRPVAIKLLPPGKAKDTALRDRFLREARTAAKLSHPKRRLEQLQDALGEAGTEERGIGKGADAGTLSTRRDRITRDLEAERDLVQRRLGDAVAALETIRMNMLRLHAGTGSVQRITTDLGLAREVAEQVDGLLEAHAELDADVG